MPRPSALVGLPALALAHLILGVARPPGVDPMALGDAVAPQTALGWIIRIVATAAAALTFVIGPGLLLRRLFGPHLLLGPAFVWVPGVLLLASTGLASWYAAPRLDPHHVAFVVLAPVAVVLLAAAWRLPPRAWFLPGELAVCGLLLLLVMVGTAKATWSAGPEGELYGGMVARSLEPSDRSDSKISYHVLQLAAHGQGRLSSSSVEYFAPYSFSDRGPIAGLAATPVVLGGGARPPQNLPFQPWLPFDPQGFAAYRITLEVLAATVVLSTFGLLSSLFSRRVAWAGTLLVATTPFIVHEIYFTWPKLLAASFGVAALTALLKRHGLVAGGLLGLSYLAHPVGLFIAQAVLGIWFGLEWQKRTAGRNWAQRRAWALNLGRTFVPVVVGVAVCALAWRHVNADSFHQGDRFGNYLFHANNVQHGVTPADWVASRLRSLGNTVVPFELVIWDRDEPHLTLFAHGRELLGFLYWNTLPFAVGIVFFPVFLAGLFRFTRRNLAVAVGGVIVPFVTFTLYWGSFITGLMREGLHGWFVFALLAAFLGNSVIDRSDRWSRVVRATLATRGLDLVIMLGATSVMADGVLDTGPFLVTDLVALAVMVGAVGTLTVLTWRAFTPASDAAEELAPARHLARPAGWLTGRKSAAPNVAVTAGS